MDATKDFHYIFARWRFDNFYVRKGSFEPLHGEMRDIENDSPRGDGILEAVDDVDLAKGAETKILCCHVQE